ncbi:MAG: FAD/NAD(P)-binding oxidoreductase [Bacteroidota bacterium]
MKKLLILGAGTGGTIMANRLHKELPSNDWSITIIDEDKTHYYQPGFLFIPFGSYKETDVVKPKVSFIPPGVEFKIAKIDRVDGSSSRVFLETGEMMAYDILIIATGTRILPDDTPGMKGDLWYKKVFDFYTLEGANALARFLDTWEGGHMVVNIAEMPIKCPVAPLEFAFSADSYFEKRGIRNKVQITYSTPLSGAFTKPKASRMLGNMLIKKNINIVPDFSLMEVDNDKQLIRDYNGKEIPFDVLITIPLHGGDPMIGRSGLGDDLNFVPVNKNTLQSNQFQNIFVIGDAGNFPASKAGSVAHFQSDVLIENLLCYITGKPFTASFDGHSNCFIESGHGKGILIDFNYDTEPLPGLFPYAGIGPLKLLKESRLNHLGKLAFRWIYWSILLRGRKMPISSKMTMAGKKTDKNI